MANPSTNAEPTMTRAAVHREFDAVVDLAPEGAVIPTHAYALLKRTYRVVDGALVSDAPVPLRHDFRRRGGREPDFGLGTDFWTEKTLTDVVVRGCAFAPLGRPVAQMEVSCRAGDRIKRIAVFGRRHIEWRGTNAQIGAIEPFEQIPVDNAHAYGGIDTRVPYPPFRSVLEAMYSAIDHPGAYPRNDTGKGYYVMPGRFDGIELPNLENPDDLLTDERLVVGRPEGWTHQPAAWSLDWQPPWVFPRCAFLGTRARYGVPAEDLPEVRQGILPADYAELLAADRIPAEQTTARVLTLRARFFQEASTGLQLGPLREGTPVEVRGMRPDGAALAFSLPPPPRLEIVVLGEAEPVPPLMTNLVIVPAEGRVMVTYCGKTGSLPRSWVRGVHAAMPLSLRVDGAAEVPYQPPPVIAQGSSDG